MKIYTVGGFGDETDAPLHAFSTFAAAEAWVKASGDNHKNQTYLGYDYYEYYVITELTVDSFIEGTPTSNPETYYDQYGNKS